MTTAAASEVSPAPAQPPRCRFCGEPLTRTFVDLGMSPLCESFLSAGQLDRMEPFYPLTVRVCDACFLVQLSEYVRPAEIFGDYAYFSSYSASWLDHARRYTETTIERFGLGPSSRVVEVASNDGYLLQYFVRKGIPVLGVEPAANVAKAAEERGVPTWVGFFGTESAKRLARERGRADLMIGNNVLAQVPDVTDFVEGFRILLAPEGVATLEFPHLLRLIEGNQFDTIYHEHFSYFSFLTAEAILASHGLRLFDVEELPTHGGSLRLYACQRDSAAATETPRVAAMRRLEKDAGLARIERYSSFPEQVHRVKRDLLKFLIAAREAGKTIAGYGAPGKGNTLLNYCGIRTDLLAYTVDLNPHKHGKYLPGTHIPIFPPERIRETRPDYVFILPWNLKDEIMEQLAYVRDWGGRFLVPIPEVREYR
ncbi:MAG: methyltransferase domain-containing protein [Thermoanaerobaculia bacterium]